MSTNSNNNGAQWRVAFAKFAKGTEPDAYLRDLNKIKGPLLKQSKRFSVETLARHLAGEPYNLSITAKQLGDRLKLWGEPKPRSKAKDKKAGSEGTVS